MVRKQCRDQIDILNVGLALARQHVGAFGYERKLRPYRQAILLKVPPHEVPIEVAFAIVEDNAASSMLVSPKRVLRKSRCQVAEAVAPEDIGSKIERDSEYCYTGPVEPAGRAHLDLVARIMEDGVLEVCWIHPATGEMADDTQSFSALQELMAYAFDERARLEKEKRNRWWWRDTSDPPGILAETKALLQHYRAELLTESGRLLQERTT